VEVVIEIEETNKSKA